MSWAREPVSQAPYTPLPASFRVLLRFFGNGARRIFYGISEFPQFPNFLGFPKDFTTILQFPTIIGAHFPEKNGVSRKN